MFSWRSFLESNRVPFVEVGPNVARGHINIRCPFCGDDDPSEHMGLNEKSGYWGCWRRHEHRGKRPHRLIIRLLGCSYDHAEELVSGGRDLSDFERLADEFTSPQSKKSKEVGDVLRMPDEFRKITGRGLSRFYLQYLAKRRGFGDDASLVVKKYDLRFCTSGLWRKRVLFPLYFEGSLVCWTGRAIYSSQTLRYMSLSEKKTGEWRTGDPLAVKNVKNLIWNYDELKRTKGAVLAINEGPMDGLKVDFYGRKIGVRATCLFGTGVTDEQVSLLADIAGRFENVVVMRDQEAVLNEIDLMAKLGFLRPKALAPPKGVEDPGAMTKKQITKVFSKFI